MRTKLLLLSVVLLAILLRFYQIENLPPGQNRDELSLGYTAYSILITGKDEYGTSYPLSVKSFGDWKLPLYVYLTVVPIKLFGLSIFSTRLVSMLSGILSIVVVYFLAKQIFRREKSRTLSSLLSAYLFAFLPWNVYFSRVAYESNLALFLVLLATYLFIRWKDKVLGIALSAVLFGLTLFTYHSTHIFVPLYIFFLLLFSFRHLKNKVGVLVFVSLFASLLGLASLMTLTSADKVKISGIGIFTDKAQIYANVDLPISKYQGNERLVAKLYYNKPIYFVKKIIANYLNFYSPHFLVFNGGINPQHNLPNAGNVDFATYCFFWLGLVFVIKKESIKTLLPILLMLILSPIAASITRDAPHYARSVFAAGAIPILAAYGIISLAGYFKKSAPRQMVTIVVVIFSTVFTSLYFYNYFIEFRQTGTKIWDEDIVMAAESVAKIESNFDFIVTTAPERSPYIYFLFASKYDPSLYQLQAVRYVETDEGFSHVMSFGKYRFVRKLNWDKITKLRPNFSGTNLKRVLLIDWNKNMDKPSDFVVILTPEEYVDNLYEN